MRDKGHFGVPKVIYGGGATGFYSDENGDYAMTQWCTGIVAPKEEHSLIINVLNSQLFNQFKLALSVSKAEINTKNLRLFKAGWWHAFSNAKSVDDTPSCSHTTKKGTTCSHTTKKGTSCTRQARVGDKCTQHSKM